MEEMMHKIKKYANRKLYDTTDKKYISLDHLAELIKAGEEVTIVDNRTGEDITSSIVSQLLARDKKDDDATVPSSILIEFLRKGSGTLVDYAKKYTTLFQSAMTMAEDEIDRLVTILVKEKEISESEGSRLRKEITSYAENIKRWMGDNMDHRIKEVLNVMNLVTKEQVRDLSAKIEALAKKIEKLEKAHDKGAAKHASDT
jgi:polyhydroxyalkanoate synthesis repressor PhaR